MAPARSTLFASVIVGKLLMLRETDDSPRSRTREVASGSQRADCWHENGPVLLRLQIWITT